MKVLIIIKQFFTQKDSILAHLQENMCFQIIFWGTVLTHIDSNNIHLQKISLDKARIEIMTMESNSQAHCKPIVLTLSVLYTKQSATSSYKWKAGLYYINSWSIQ
jgi:hypothetical protein